MPDRVPFRVEFMGDPPLPFVVVDGGDRTKPYDRHTMRSWLIPGEVKAEFVLSWEAYVHAEVAAEALRQELAAVTEQRDFLLREYGALKDATMHRDALEQVATTPAAGAVADVTTTRRGRK